MFSVRFAKGVFDKGSPSPVRPRVKHSSALPDEESPWYATLPPYLRRQVSGSLRSKDGRQEKRQPFLLSSRLVAEQRFQSVIGGSPLGTKSAGATDHHVQ